MNRPQCHVGQTGQGCGARAAAPSHTNAGDVGDEELDGGFRIDVDGNVALALRIADAAGDGSRNPTPNNSLISVRSGRDAPNSQIEPTPRHG